MADNSSSDMNVTGEEWHKRLDTNFSRRGELIMGSFFLSFGILGSIGNSLTIFVLCRARRLYNPCTPFLVNISVADLCMTLLVLPLIGSNALSGLVLVPPPVCTLLSVTFHAIFTTSWLCLAVVSVIRCQAVWSAERYVASKRWVKFWLAFVWLLPFGLTFAVAYPAWYTREHTGILCAFFCGLQAMRQSNGSGVSVELGLGGDGDSSNVIQILEMVSSGVPFVLISICYLLIFAKMRGSKRTLQQLGIAAFNKHVKEEKFTRMMILIFSSLSFCFFLPTVFNLIQSAHRGGSSSIFQRTDYVAHETIWIVAYIVVFVPFVSNPIIYVLSNRNYRKAYLALLCPRLAERSASTMSAANAANGATPGSARSNRQAVTLYANNSAAFTASTVWNGAVAANGGRFDIDGSSKQATVSFGSSPALVESKMMVTVSSTGIRDRSPQRDFSSTFL